MSSEIAIGVKKIINITEAILSSKEIQTTKI